MHNHYYKIFRARNIGNYIARFLFVFIIVFQNCQPVPEILTPNPDPESANNIITCEYCSDFGHIIEFYDDQLIIAEYQNIYIYKLENGIWRLRYEMINQQVSGIGSIEIHGTRMAIGIAEADGDGRVEIYQNENGIWNLDQTLSAGRRQDFFGSAIDMTDDRIIIGASAPWVDGSNSLINEDHGRIYIYRFETGSWIKEDEFEAKNPEPDDRFGQTVSIYENFAFAGGGNTTGLHMYKLDSGNWSLDSLIDLEGVSAIDHSDNKFLIRNTIGYEPKIMSFSIEEDGTLIPELVNSDFDGQELSDQGEILEVYKDLALIDYETADYCDLFEYSNGSWTKRDQLTGQEGIFCEYFGLAISDNRVAIGGNNYVFIKDL